MTDAPVTQAQLQEALAPIRVELVDLRTDVNDLRTDVNGLRTDVDGLRTDVNGLKQDIAQVIVHIGEAASHVANVVMEHTRMQIAALDDKYRDAPKTVESLRDDLDAHVADIAVHVKPSGPRVRSRARGTRRS